MGGTHPIVHPASTVLAPGGIGSSLQVLWQPHVQVDGQSESVLHAPVCCATHFLYVTSVHVVPGWQMDGMESPGGRAASASGKGPSCTALHGTTVTMAYGGWLASWSFPQSYEVTPLDAQVYPGPQSGSATQGASHCGTHALYGPHVWPPSAAVTHCVAMSR